MTYVQQRNTPPTFIPAVEVAAYLVVGGTVRIYYPGKSYFQIIGRITTMPPMFAASNLKPGEVVFDRGPRIRIGIREQREIRIAPYGSKPDTVTVMTDLSPEGWLFSADARSLAWSAYQIEGTPVSVQEGQPLQFVGDARSAMELTRIQDTMSKVLPEEAARASALSVQRGLKEKLPVIRGTFRLRLQSSKDSRWYRTTLIVDGQQVHAVSSLSTPLVWDSKTLPDGEYVIEATATSTRAVYRRVRKRMLVINNLEGK